MLIRHDVNTVVGTLERPVMEDVFLEALRLLRHSKYVHKTICDLEDGKIDSMEATDVLEDFVQMDFQSLSLFCSMRCSVSEMNNKYLERVIMDVHGYHSKLSAAVDCMFNLKDTEIATLKTVAYDVASGMTFFCSFEFDLLNIISSNEVGDLEVDELVQAYCDKTLENPVYIAEEVREDMKHYRIRFDVFDAFPELEDEFFAVMGPSITGIDQTSLTIEDVRDVIFGNISPDDLVMRVAVQNDSLEQEVLL